MNWYAVRLSMRASSGTFWQADTIFGHLCWALRYLDGEKALAQFLEWYDNGMPPVLVSNGFPGELLPNPVMPPPAVRTGLPLPEQVKGFRSKKETRKVVYLTPGDFTAVLVGQAFDVDSYRTGEHGSVATATRVTLKNQISRLTGGTGEGGQLFEFEETFWDSVTIYLKIESGFVDMAARLFGYLGKVGYGKRKSVGYGQMGQVSFDSFDGFASPADANGFLTLSNFVPAESDPVRGHWRMLVKYGKLGEEYATSGNPFKKPLLMLEAGSTFYDSPCREYYGRLVHGLSTTHREVVQYAFALPVPMRLPD